MLQGILINIYQQLNTYASESSITEVYRMSEPELLVFSPWSHSLRHHGTYHCDDSFPRNRHLEHRAPAINRPHRHAVAVWQGNLSLSGLIVEHFG